MNVGFAVVCIAQIHDECCKRIEQGQQQLYAEQDGNEDGAFALTSTCACDI
jgi:hypothetical protein